MSLLVTIPHTNRNRSHSALKPTEAQGDGSFSSPDLVAWDGAWDPGDTGRGDGRVLGSLEKEGQNGQSVVPIPETRRCRLHAHLEEARSCTPPSSPALIACQCR